MNQRRYDMTKHIKYYFIFVMLFMVILFKQIPVLANAMYELGEVLDKV